MCFVLDKKRYEVVLSESEETDDSHMAVKPENLAFESGAKVVLWGLQSACHLNGHYGEVVEFSEALSRYVIELYGPDKKQVKVKPENAVAR